LVRLAVFAGFCSELSAIEISFPQNCDILGLGMFHSCEIRVHPTGSAIARLGTISQGQGHVTTFPQTSKGKSMAA
jgi:hypothetical protein